MKTKILLICFTFWCAYSMAQQKSTLVGADKKTVKLFFEKSYLHTDRSYYSSGENIWFSAYLVNGKSTSLTGTSNNLYVELISPTAQMLERKLIRINGGLGHGDFKLKDSIPSGWYQLRAYTNWMRNFGDDFVFQKKIYVANTVGGKAVTPSSSAAANSKKISFFPEGGSMVTGLAGIVAFKATDNLGNGIEAKGSVISAKGDTITTFQSTDAGIGLFAFMPVAGEKYHVEGAFGNEPFKLALPAILEKGLSLHLTVDSANIKAAITANEPMFNELQNKPLTVIIKHAGDNIYTGTINLSKSSAAVTIPTKDLPQGIAVVTVVDYLGRPNCERLVYIQSSDKINLSISPSKTVYNSREKVSLKIKATNTLGQPIKTSFSLSAVDALIPDDGIDIVSYFMLQSEVKGEIKNPGQYFDPKNASRFKQLNLLLLTQGWRDYLWKKIADSNIKISYLPEPGITIKGSVREKLADKPLANMNITLFGTNFIDSKIFTTRTDQYGNYYLDGLNWYGNQPVKISSKFDNAKKGGWLQIDSTFKPFPINIRMGMPPIIPSGVTEEISKRMAYNRTYKTGDAIELDEVKVVAGKTGKVEMFDQTLRTFGYTDQVFNISASDYSYKGLEHYLLTNANGAQPLADNDTTGNEGVSFLANGARIRPRIIVNGREDLTERLDYYSLTMDQINQIVVKHLVDNTGKDVFVISLNLKDSALRGPNLDLLNINLNGYYEAKAFYAPDYSTTPTAIKDLRTTIFWAPLLKTNESGEVNVSFYNGDNKTSIVVKAEGITDKGTAVATKTNYKVQ